jgi:hypothetical protein
MGYTGRCQTNESNTKLSTDVKTTITTDEDDISATTISIHDSLTLSYIEIVVADISSSSSTFSEM